MKKSTLLALVLSAVAVVAIGAYFIVGRGGSAYLNAIPGNATALIKVDAKELLKEADLSLSEAMKLIKIFTADSTEKVGIDLLTPVYVFASEAGDFGAVAAVDDVDDLKAFIASLNEGGEASEITEARGFSWAVVQQQWLCAFDKQKVLVMGPAVGADQDNLRNQMATLLTQSKKESVQATELFEQLRKVKAPLSAVVSPEMVPGDATSYLRKAGVESSKDALLLLSLAADDNELQFESELVALNDSVKKYVKQVGSLLRPMKADMLKYAHSQNAAWLGFNIEGSKLLELLRSNEESRAAAMGLNLIVDFDRILEAIDGDVALELTNPINMKGRDPITPIIEGLSFVAKVGNTDFISGASDWGNDYVKVQSVNDKNFALDLGSSKLYLGVDKKTFYLGSQQGLQDGGNDLLDDHKKDIKGARLFLSLELNDLIEQNSRTFPILKDLKDFERLLVVMPEANKLRLHLLAPEETNIAKALLMDE